MFWQLILIILFLVQFHGIVSQTPLSKPVYENAQFKSNRFSSQQRIENVNYGQDATFQVYRSPQCQMWKKSHPNSPKHSSVRIRWQQNVGSSVYQTPLIASFGEEKDVAVATMIRYLELLKGKDGQEKEGWPFSSRYIGSHSSPLLYDVNGDGEMEIVLSDLNGKVLFFDQGGKLTNWTIQIMPLPVKKLWFKDLGHDESPNTTEEAFLSKFFRSLKFFTSKSASKQLDNEISSQEVLPASEMATAKRDDRLTKEAQDAIDDFMISHSVIPSWSENKNVFVDPSHAQRFKDLQRSFPKHETVFIDPHILSTPIIIDLDQDGHDELIVAVSYYFDKEYYSNPNHRTKLPIDIDPSNYVAGGIVVFDLVTRKVKWNVHLDLTTDKTEMKALIHGSPTIIDLDGNGKLDVIIGTSLGVIYALDSQGHPKKGWPVHMGEIQGQVLAEDINGDGNVEICSVDLKSNLVCYDSTGKVLWEKRISGSSPQVPVVGDINGDGILEIVIGTSTGHIWALRADNGETLEHFPVKTKGPIYAPALLLDMNMYSRTNRNHFSLSVIVPSFDGFLYVIDGRSGCVRKIDIGEQSYSQVLADDLLRTGKLQLIVSTMNGNLFCMETEIPYHPLKARVEQVHSVNGFSYRYGVHGIHIAKDSRKFRDIIGNRFRLVFKITDNRKLPKNHHKSYHVKIYAGSQKLLFEKMYYHPGGYSVIVPAIPQRKVSTITISMRNEMGQHFSDYFVLSFNMHFTKILKWIIVIPIIFVALLLSKFTKQKTPIVSIAKLSPVIPKKKVSHPYGASPDIDDIVNTSPDILKS